MSCFSYAGAEDLDSVLSQTSPVELSTDSESSDDEQFPTFTSKRKTALGKRKTKQPPPKKPAKQQKKSNEDATTHLPSSINEVMSLLSSSDDDDIELESLEGFAKPSFPTSSTREVNGALFDIENTLRQARSLKNSQRKFELDLEDSPITPKSKAPSSIAVHVLCEGVPGTLKLTIAMNDTFEKVLEVLSTIHENIVIDENTKMKLDGMPLKLSETPKMYKMSDGDTIKVYPGGQLFEDLGGDFGDLPVAPVGPVETDLIRIIVRQSADKTNKFSIKKTDTFQKLFDGYCAHVGVDPSTCTFIFDGEELDLECTPEEEDMDDDDIVDVKFTK